jgi:cell division protein FtsB
MGGFGLNLSTRPFPAYRAANLGLTAILVILIAVSVWQGYSYVHYSKKAAAIRADERTIRAEAEALKATVAQLQSRLDRPEAARKLTEIDYLNNLIARKNFSWTRVFANLEQMKPEGVHLTSLRPEISEEGRILLHIDVRGRSIVDIGGFIEKLEKSGLFENVIPQYEEKLQEKKDIGARRDVDVNVALTMTYLPEGLPSSSGRGQRKGKAQ